MNSFDEFGLTEPILRALAQENYVTPTPIQAQTIPSALSGRDIVGIAQTGTGKTAAFALPILHRLAAAPQRAERKTCRVLVLSPTRELSSQILDSFNAYGRHLGLTATLAIGGVPMGRQVRALLNGVDVLVATPGRLLDLVHSNALRLGHVGVLVLDEADRMLDMGFIHDIRKIVAKLPTERQTLFFSATMPQQIAELARQMLRDPVKVAVTPAATTVETVAQRVIHVDRAGKPAMLADLLRGETIDRSLVFTRTKHGADKVVRGLAKAGIAAQAIHGNKSQNLRERVLAEFRAGRIRTLVATDIAARGIDVDGISHVFNFDLPNEPETYVHRIGRTARAGATGVAISLCGADEAPYLRAIEKLIRLTIPSEGYRSAPRDPQPGERADAGHRHHAPGGHRRAKHARGGQGHQAHDGQGRGRTDHDAKRHGGQGRGAQGHGARGHGANGQDANGHGASGHGASGHGASGHGANRHGGKGHGGKGHGRNGHAANRHGGRGGHPAEPGRSQPHRASQGGHRQGSHAEPHAQRRGGSHKPAGHKPGGHQPQNQGRPAASGGQDIAGVGFMRRPVPARRDDAGRPPR